MDNQNTMTPAEYFDYVKNKKNAITNKELLKIYDNCLTLLNKYKITGQIKGIKKLIFHLETIEKELEIVKIGIDTFIYRDDIEEYIDNIEKNTVKIIELENYEREIPDEIVNIIAKTKDKFDRMYVLFTDYTGKIEKQVQKERRNRDPILFGTFQDEYSQAVIDRFYFLGDWEDEYCDLTLDRMVNRTKQKTKKDIEMKISTPQDIKELKKQLKQLEIDQNNNIRMTKISKPSFFKKVKTFFTKK